MIGALLGFAVLLGLLAGYVLSSERHYERGRRDERNISAYIPAPVSHRAGRARPRSTGRRVPYGAQLVLTTGAERDPIYLAGSWTE